LREESVQEPEVKLDSDIMESEVGNTLKMERARPSLNNDSWLGMLRRWLVPCPRCREISFVVGIREGDQHVCKACGHRFSATLMRVYEDRDLIPRATAPDRL
jgi:hypothetical protein